MTLHDNISYKLMMYIIISDVRSEDIEVRGDNISEIK